MEEKKIDLSKKTFTHKEVMQIVASMQEEHKKNVIELQNRAASAFEKLNGAVQRLGILLQIVSIKDVFSKEFIARCVKEIEDIITIPEEDDKDNGSEQNTKEA